ncbi:MAG: hypothetical protein DIU69_03640, partial [Bacillota bacterium]
MMRRIAAVMHKEFIHLRRDRRTLAMMIVIPLVWLILFGYAFSFDVSDLRVAVVDRSGTDTGRILARAFHDYEKFRPVDLPVPGDASLPTIVEDARERIRLDEVDMVILLPPSFGEPGEQARLQVMIDGSQLFSAQAGARLLQEAMEEVLDEVQEEIRDDLRAEVVREAQERLEAEWESRLAAVRDRLRALG